MIKLLLTLLVLVSCQKQKPKETKQKSPEVSAKAELDISKDMFVMLWPYLYATNDKQNLREIYNYAKANGNVMGRGVLSRTLLTPPMILFLQELLGMIPFAAEKEVVKEPFEKHLDLIHLMTASMHRGGVTATEYELETVRQRTTPERTRTRVYMGLTLSNESGPNACWFEMQRISNQGDINVTST